MTLPDFESFELEEWQSRWEQGVTHNLADSGVRAPSLRQLEALGADLAPLLDVSLHYPEVQGTRALRERISALHPGATPEGVLVTVGAAEAGMLAVETLTRPGDDVCVLTPSYPQVEGLLRNRGCRVRTFRLDPGRGWSLDQASLERAVLPTTRVVAICNPNNPTGRILPPAELEAIRERARSVGATLVVDEVYRGTEHDGVERPTLFQPGERTVVLGSLSKAYGMPGLRLGWMVGTSELTQALWRRHEYAAISAAGPSMAVAEQVLAAPLRERLLSRTRGLIQQGLATLRAWLEDDGSALRWTPPESAAFAFLQLPDGTDGDGWTAELRDRSGVLLAPGSAFGHPEFVRLTYALDPNHLAEALHRITPHLAPRF
ncbi:MAG: pyridoxal phosphate-dependent aminotransferase [Candidatus Dormibacteraeota bacterium]|nr:pyridoxal phosphate-dependent aminotransferase [Candidatus Dormibacteraeota bacterium]